MGNKQRRRQRHGRPGVPLPQQPVSHNPRLTEAILEIVDTQLRDGTPPETMQTLARLVKAGYTPEGARQLIANVVVAEIFEVMSRGEPYKQERFIAALHRLPILPWE